VGCFATRYLIICFSLFFHSAQTLPQIVSLHNFYQSSLRQDYFFHLELLMKDISLTFKVVWPINPLPRRFFEFWICVVVRFVGSFIEKQRWGLRQKGWEVGKTETERRLNGVGWWMAEWWWFCVQNQNTGEYGAKGWRGSTKGRWSGSGTRMAGVED